jgi:hypothetical protein
MWLESPRGNRGVYGWLTSVCTVWFRLNLEAGQVLTHRYHHVTVSKNGVPLDASKAAVIAWRDCDQSQSF